MSTDQLLASYLEQFTGNEVVTGFIVVSGDAVYINEVCPYCKNQLAKRAVYHDMNGQKKEFWRCMKCGGTF